MHALLLPTVLNIDVLVSNHPLVIQSMLFTRLSFARVFIGNTPGIFVESDTDYRYMYIQQ